MKTPITILAILVLGAAFFTGCQEKEAITKELENAKNNVLDEHAKLQQTAQDIQQGYQQLQSGLESGAKTVENVKNTVDSVTSQIPR